MDNLPNELRSLLLIILIPLMGRSAFAVEFTVDAIPFLARDLNDRGGVLVRDSAAEPQFWSKSTGVVPILPGVNASPLGLSNDGSVLLREHYIVHVPALQGNIDTGEFGYLQDIALTRAVEWWPDGSTIVRRERFYPSRAARAAGDFTTLIGLNEEIITEEYGIPHQTEYWGVDSHVETTAIVFPNGGLLEGSIYEHAIDWTNQLVLSQPPDAPLVLHSVGGGLFANISADVASELPGVAANSVRRAELTSGHQVVGRYRDPLGVERGFVWSTDGVIGNLPLLSSYTLDGWALALESGTTNYWNGTSIVNVATQLVTDDNVQIQRLLQINNQHQILAEATINGGPLQSVLLTPLAFHWTNAAGGDWNVGDNWSDGQPPGASDTAEFNLPDTYTVALTAPVQTAAVRVDQGDVTFDLAGQAMDLGSVAVGTVPGQSAILRVPDIDNFNPESIVVGGDEDAEAALVLGPDAANPAGVGAGDPDGSLGGSGAFLPDTSLMATHRSRVVIQNATAELGSITAPSQSEPVPVPHPSLAAESERIVIKNSNIQVNGDVTLEKDTHFTSTAGDDPGTLRGVASTIVADRLLSSAGFTITDGTELRLPPPSGLTSLEVRRGLARVLNASKIAMPNGAGASIGETGDATVEVRGGSAIMAAGSEVTIANGSNAAVVVSDQSTLTAHEIRMGKVVQTLGELTVSSLTGKSTVNAPQITVAEGGSGRLIVEDGGEVNSQTVDIGNAEPSPPGTGSSEFSLAGGQSLADGAGQLIVNGTGVVNAQTINIGTLGAVLGTGTIEVTNGVFNSGKVKPGSSPGTLTIVGPYVQSATGELEIEFGGSGSGQYDLLAVQGDATVDGIIALQFIDGFAPQQGQQFEFVTATGATDISGAEFAIRNLAPGFMFDITPSAEGMMMTALNDGVFVPDAIPGDYNNDGTVDAADYVVWRKNPDAFGGDDGYSMWRANFGRATISGTAGNASAAVPEPTTTLLVWMTWVATAFGMMRRIATEH